MPCHKITSRPLENMPGFSWKVSFKKPLRNKFRQIIVQYNRSSDTLHSKIALVHLVLL
jgi:hypothetical protein